MGKAVLLVVVVGLMVGAGYFKHRADVNRAHDNMVLSNAHALSSASEMYMMENGVKSVRFEDLIGPDKMLKRFTKVGDEVYPTIFRAEDHGVVTVTGVRGSHTVAWSPK